MPKRVNKWNDIKPPQTPLQRGVYLDACTAWLIAEPETTEVLSINVPTTDPLSHSDTGVDDSIARSFTNLHDRRDWLCIICNAMIAYHDVIPQVVNPFSQHGIVATCKTCRK